MRALLIQHDHLCLPGFVGERLGERGYAIEAHQVVPEDRYHSPAVDTEFPDPRDFEVVVALGAAWSAYDDSLHSWLLPELQLLRDAHEAQVPVLGVCFGGQLLAAAHGGSVAAAAQPEIGWYDVRVRRRPRAGRPLVPVALRPLAAARGGDGDRPQSAGVPGLRARPQSRRPVPSRTRREDPARLAGQRRRRRGAQGSASTRTRCSPTPAGTRSTAACELTDSSTRSWTGWHL